MSAFDRSTPRAEQKREEQALFEAFAQCCPDFAGEDVLHSRLAGCGSDPPDVICTTTSGKLVGVEICQWAHQGEMKAGKLRQEIDGKLLEAIGVPQPMNTSKNFELVVFFPKTEVHITPHEYRAFREALFRLIQHVDGARPVKHAGGSYRFPDLNRFPPLDKHLQQIKFVPGEAFTSGADWIVPVVPAGWFDDRIAPNALDELISKKKKSCSSLKTPCDELYLLIAYDQALLHCSPITKVGEIAKEAAVRLVADRGPFNRVYLFLAIEPGYKVYRLL